MNGYAETYAQTVKGKIERMTGVWETMKAEIMGIDVKTGTAKELGAFAVIAEQVDHLKNVLEDGATASSIEKVSKAFGSAFESLGNAFNKAVTPETIDKVASAIVKIGESLAKMIDKFVSSGQLDKLLQAAPTVVDKVARNEVIQKTTDFKVNADMAQGNYGYAAYDKFKGAVDWGYNAFANNTNRENIQDSDYWSTKLFYTIQGLAGVDSLNDTLSQYDDKFFLTDANASTAIDKNKSLSDDQKSQLKDIIKTDNTSTYNISIAKIEANNFDEIMKSIQDAAQNRK